MELHKDFLENNENFPNNVTDAFNMLVNYKGSAVTPAKGGGRETLAFVAKTDLSGLGSCLTMIFLTD